MAIYKRPTLLDNIKRMLLLPCHQNGAVYVELAFDAFINFAFQVAEPDAKEIYHHVVGEPLVHTIRTAIDDAGEALGSSPTPVRRALGRLIGLEDRLIWWNFLLSVADDTLTDATSLAIRMDPCLSGRGLGSGTQWVSALQDNGRWAAIDFQFPEGSPFWPAHPSIVLVNEATGWEGTVAASPIFKNSNNQVVGTNGRIRWSPFDGSGDVILDTFTNSNSKGEPKQTTTDVFYKWGAPKGQAGNLFAEFQYVGPPQPSHEVFEAEGSTCYLNGLP